MDKPKELTGLDSDNYDYPLADVSHLSEKEKQDLLRRGMHIPKELHSDEEFEQWVTLFAEWNTYSYSDGHKPTEELPQAMNAACGITASVSTNGRKNICNRSLTSWRNTLLMTRNMTGNICMLWSMPNYVA